MPDEKMYVISLILSDVEYVKSIVSKTIESLYSSSDNSVLLRKKNVLDFISCVHNLVDHIETTCAGYME